MINSSPLVIGVVLKNGYVPAVGGGYSCYSKIIQAIDKKTDWRDMEFVFIYLTYSAKQDPGPNPSSFQKPFLLIDLETSDKKQHKLYSLYYHLRAIPYFKSKAREKLLFIQQVLYKKFVESQLVKNDIDLLYYPIPSSNPWNYPFIATHWDIGHQSMFAFPEVTMNGTYEGRENIYKNMKKAFAIFCESEAGRDELSFYKGINRERIFVIPAFPGEVIEQHVSEPKQLEILASFHLVKNKFFFYPAQFWSHKNHYNLIMAFNELLKSYSGIKLVFTGSDQGNLPYIKQIVEQLSLADSIVHLGFVTLQELFTLYNNCIAMVMPTFLGPTNLPLLEAAALGCPVITSDFKGHREMLGTYATYINPADPHHILKSMMMEMNKDNHKRHQFVNPEFTIEGCLNSLQENFLSLHNIRRTFGFNFEQY